LVEQSSVTSESPVAKRRDERILGAEPVRLTRHYWKEKRSEKLIGQAGWRKVYSVQVLSAVVSMSLVSAGV
jgi:hypothetical protein